MRSCRCCYGNSGEQGLGAARQQVRKEKWGRRQSTHLNASSLSPCWSHVIPNYHCSEGKGERWGGGVSYREYRRRKQSIQVSAWTFETCRDVARAEVNTHTTVITRLQEEDCGKKNPSAWSACEAAEDFIALWNAGACGSYSGNSAQAETFSYEDSPPWNADLPFIIYWVIWEIWLWFFILFSWSNQWDLRSSRCHCRGKGHTWNALILWCSVCVCLYCLAY